MRRIARTAVVALLPMAAALHGAAAHEGPEAHDVAATGLPAPVLLDKAAQRRAGIRTATPEDLAPRIAIAGRAIADPRTASRVAADQAGRVEPPPEGFPLPGAPVHAGQVLGFLVPVMSDPERRDLDSDLTNARRDVAIGRMQVERFQVNEAEAYDIRLPTPSLQLLSDYHAAQAREGQFNAALAARVPLVAPTKGSMIASYARSDRVVSAGAPLFELMSPGGVAIEAYTADDAVDPASVAQAQSGAGAIPVHLLSAGFDPASRARRLLYAVDGAATLAPGEPVALRAMRTQGDPQVRWLPREAVLGAGASHWIWVHAEAERFVAMPVTEGGRDGDAVRVRGDFDGDERIVVAGASTLAVTAPR